MNTQELRSFIIEHNEYLSINIEAYYRTDYLKFGKPNNPDYLNHLKNTYNSLDKGKLITAANKLIHNLNFEISYICKKVRTNEPIAICVVPRSKSDNYYSLEQRFFLLAIQQAVDSILKQNISPNIIDGTNWITRHTDTRTTHLSRETQNYENTGPDPYVGITKDTCNFSDDIINKHILLIDDVYTKTKNIAEDCIQALLDKGGKSVTFFAIAKTLYREHL